MEEGRGRVEREEGYEGGEGWETGGTGKGRIGDEDGVRRDVCGDIIHVIVGSSYTL